MPRAFSWTSQQVRNFQMHIVDQELQCERLCRDNDTKYVKEFDAVFTSSGCKIKKITPLSPNLQAHVERVIQTLKHEVLNAFCIVSDRHMDHILRTAQDWYNKRRGHTARDHLPPVRDLDPPLLPAFPTEKIICDAELGGYLKSYRRVA
jgi:putative transposase